MRVFICICIILFLSNNSFAETSEEKVAALVQGCEGDNPKACVDIGMIYLVGNILPKDKETAAMLFNEGCKRGAGSGCTFYGYNKFEGVSKNERDYTKAREYYKMACDLGHGYGCSLIGLHHEKAFGIVQDYEIARNKYERACLLKDYIGCTSLGNMYDRGNGVSKNLEKAKYFYAKACKYGNKHVCNK